MDRAMRSRSISCSAQSSRSPPRHSCRTTPIATSRRSTPERIPRRRAPRRRQRATTLRSRCQVACPSTGITKTRPNNSGSDPSTRPAAMMSPHRAIGPGFAATVRTEVAVKQERERHDADRQYQAGEQETDADADADHDPAAIAREHLAQKGAERSRRRRPKRQLVEDRGGEDPQRKDREQQEAERDDRAE